jgi:Zn-dependent peptidase ImmA (M78 family)
MNEVFVRFVTLPTAVRAFTMPDEEGDYNIYINTALSDEQKRASLIHEQSHIARDDFYKDMPVRMIEAALKPV